MESPSPAKIALALALAATAAGCGPSPEEDRAQSGPIRGPFIVSDYFVPSGLMGDGAVPGQVTVSINENCKQPRPPGAQGDCYRFDYDVAKEKWAGAFWVYPANSWGTVPGRLMQGPVDLGVDATVGAMHGYHYVRFWAAIEPLPNPPFVQYWAGRIDGRKATPPQPFFDEGCRFYPGMPARCTEDRVNPLTNVTETVPFAFAPTEDGARFTPEWQQFKIDLSGWSIQKLIGAFGWSSNDTDNPGMHQTLYFDDIVWE